MPIHVYHVISHYFIANSLFKEKCPWHFGLSQLPDISPTPHSPHWVGTRVNILSSIKLNLYHKTLKYTIDKCLYFVEPVHLEKQQIVSKYIYIWGGYTLLHNLLTKRNGRFSIDF